MITAITNFSQSGSRVGLGQGIRGGFTSLQDNKSRLADTFVNSNQAVAFTGGASSIMDGISTFISRGSEEIARGLGRLTDRGFSKVEEPILVNDKLIHYSEPGVLTEIELPAGSVSERIATDAQNILDPGDVISDPEPGGFFDSILDWIFDLLS
ncbi:MAG: hypothetical protein PHC64_09250 [Candidatus Gastranaerophilales bacterium]|nr:hypothetical protein [Candidatus Gastranaerophilales bacterium]